MSHAELVQITIKISPVYRYVVVNRSILTYIALASGNLTNFQENSSTWAPLPQPPSPSSLSKN
jgi:hypothetical protein